MSEPVGLAERVVRVFVSSTFSDMQEEREELVKRVFPELRKLCEQRGVTWGEVDLRWGVTDEQKAEGKVLPICLAEIHNCRPYFLAILGERYGWIPRDIPAELVEREPWLAAGRDRSVTELEILHGVLNNPQMADRALFYFRDAAYIDSLPAARQAEFREPDAGARARLDDLKRRIRASGLPVRENYRHPQELGERVLEDLREIIDRRFPEGSQPDALAREAAEHEAFARSRARVYIGREEHFARLDAHAAGDGPPLVVVGESGVGKSALLANWALRRRRAHPDEPLVMHFVGATPFSADWVAMLRRLITELGRSADVAPDLPDAPEPLRAAFADVLFEAVRRGPLVLIIDALNQLEDRHGALNLAWLPEEIPAGARVIVSTLAGRPLEELRRRGWPSLEVEPLAVGECKRLIVEYLAQYSKSLSPDRVDRIAWAEPTANPLYLRLLLEELRLYGDHFTLDRRLEECLAAPTIEDLYQRILGRYEQDYERDRPGLVRDALTAVWAARRGLSESELLDLLGAGGRPLPRHHWSPLYLAAEASVVNRSGLLGFSHDYLRRAVESRYLSEEARRKAAHARLADYFGSRQQGPRELDELPWQLARCESWERLARTIGNPSFFAAAWQANEFEAKTWWTEAARRQPHFVSEVIDVFCHAGQENPAYLWLIAAILRDTGEPVQAGELLAMFGAYLERACHSLRDALYSVHPHRVRREQEQLDAAVALLLGDRRFLRLASRHPELARSPGAEAAELFRQGRPDDAFRLLEKQEDIFRELSAMLREQAEFGKQHERCLEEGDLEHALWAVQYQEEFWRKIGDEPGLAASLGQQASILRQQQDLEQALAALDEQERLCRKLGDSAGLAENLGQRAAIARARGESAEARGLLARQEEILRRLGAAEPLERCLNEQESLATPETPPAPAVSVAVSTPHPAADPNRAAQLNIQYQLDLRSWSALPWWQRLRTQKPEPPRGI